MDAVSDVRMAARTIANAITPIGAQPTHDATSGSVGSLTEAVIGITAALVKIAEAIELLAAVVEQR